MTIPRLFTIPPGVPFLNRLARALCDGVLIDGFAHRPEDPLALSAAMIYVPTRRAARALRSEFVDLLGGTSAFLPHIRTLGEADDDAGFLDEESPALLDLDPPIGATERLLELAQLIMMWKRHLPKSVSAIHGEDRLIAPASPADAVWLARGLAELLDAMETEERAWSEFDGLVADDHALWWQLTLEFLKIAGEFWPARLREMGGSSPAIHRNAVLRVEAGRLQKAPPSGPVIVAGSTGSIPATAELMAVVARLPQGAVVLPGLDMDLDDAVWAEIGGSPSPERRDPALCTHPQYGLNLLLRKLGAGRADVRMLAQPQSYLRQRNRLVSTALMPAAATAQWVEARAEPDVTAAAFSHVELIEAAGEREEALAIAVAMRLAADPPEDTTQGTPPRQVALVTPDRHLARRVVCELRRFGIAADDSGGTPLALTPPGALLHLLLQAAFGAADVVALMAMIKHPLVRFGHDAASARRAAQVLERVALRGGIGTAEPGELAVLFERRLGERLAQSRHAPQWQARLSEQDIALARLFAQRIDAAYAPMQAAAKAPEQTAAHWAEISARLLEATVQDEDGSLAALWDSEAGERLASLLAAVMENRSGFYCDAVEWTAMAPALVAGETVKPRAGGHPHISIWGALEARLQSVDTLILAGLNEGTWPAAVSSDPFLSRAMQAAVGLDPPERRIGLAAHDVQMGLGAPRVVLSRSARSKNAPTVASRWLQRLSAVIGDTETDRLRARGRRYLRWAAMLDAAPDRPLATRPAPKPPASTQPKRYSFSEVRTLRRDPYAIYAKRILRLDPREPLIGDPGPAERGTLYHRILECFIRETGDIGDPAASARLAAIADREFGAARLPDHIAVVWRHQFNDIARLFVDWERGRDADIAARHTERRAALHVAAADLTVSGIADRIDMRTDGLAEIIDYKTGTAPSRKVAWTLLDPQLPLEAAALRAGAFDQLAPSEVASLAYVRLRPDAVLKVDRIEGGFKDEQKEKTPADLAEEAIGRLSDLVLALASGKLGFASQIIPDSGAVYGRDFDHLARVREWSSADAGAAGGSDG